MSNKKILIVDDDADVRAGMASDTFFAIDAISTLREARKHEPDLIILNLGLPDGDGFVVIEKLS
jgi:DNA-binding response OmpR family regulator